MPPAVGQPDRALFLLSRPPPLSELKAVPGGDATSKTVEALHVLAESPETLRAMQRRARAVYDAEFWRDLGLAAWDRILGSLVDGRRRRAG